MRGTPLCTSSQRQAVGVQRRQRRRVPAPAAQRSAALAVARRAGGCTVAPSRRCRRTAPGAAPAGPARRRRPGPHSGSSALASLSLHLARSTNIDSRFSVGRQQVGAAGQQHVVGRGAPDDEAGQQPALGRAVAGQPRLAGVQVRDVLRQLAVQEAARRRRRWRGSRPSRPGGTAPSKAAGGGRGRWHHAAHYHRRAMTVAVARVSRGCSLAAGAAAAGARRWRPAPPGWWLDRPLPLAAPTVELSIEPGTTPREVAQAWVDAGVQTPPRLLYEWFRWSGQARRIRAGSYEIERRHHAARSCWTRWCRATRRWSRCA